MHYALVICFVINLKHAHVVAYAYYQYDWWCFCLYEICIML